MYAPSWVMEPRMHGNEYGDEFSLQLSHGLMGKLVWVETLVFKLIRVQVLVPKLKWK